MHFPNSSLAALNAPASKLQSRKCSHLETRNMPLVISCTNLGLNDLSSDTQDPCADQRQEAVIKSLFICLSHGFPFLQCIRCCHLCLWQNVGDNNHWSSVSLQEQGNLLYCTSSKGQPLSVMRVQGSVRSNFQVPNMRCSRGAAHCTTHPPMHTSARSTQTQAGTFTWWNMGVRAMVPGTCQAGGYPRKALQCFCPSWAVELCWGTPEISDWGGEMPAPCHCLVRDLWGQEENSQVEASSSPMVD